MPSIPGIRWSETISATIVAAGAHLLSSSSASWPELGADDPVVGAEPPPQIARDGGEHGRLVVDREDRGARTRSALLGGRRRARRFSETATQPLASIGDGGIFVSPVTSGRIIPISSMKHQLHCSPGSSERMIGCRAAARVCAGVLARGVVAAADVAALQADAQVQPDAAVAQAVLAAVDRGRQLGDLDRVQMGAAGLFRRSWFEHDSKSSSGEPHAAVDPNPDRRRRRAAPAARRSCTGGRDRQRASARGARHPRAGSRG